MYVDILILSQLIHSPKHGYEIKKSIESIFGGSYMIENSMLYPILKKFEDMGALDKRIEEQDGKPNRHVYQITDSGLEIFYELLQDYHESTAGNDNEFYVRAACFNMLEPEKKEKILKVRETVLKSRLAHYEEMTSSFPLPDEYLTAKDLLKFLSAQTQQELDWIKTL